MLSSIQLARADLNLLVLFEVVLEERHVGRAADRLKLTPSAVSHGLGRLRRLLNDPLFLRTPTGVVPTARAMELATPVAEILARARQVIASAEPFDPATSRRRFTIGAPDAVAVVFLPSLLQRLRETAPHIDLSLCQLLPPAGTTSKDRAWASGLADLEARAVDIAVLPLDLAPARFVLRTLYEEDFVIAARAGHPFADDPSLDRFCEMRHLVVSLSGDPYGFVDQRLAEVGRSRRVGVTVPNFMLALSLVAETDLIAAVPRQLLLRHSARFGIRSIEPPLPLSRDAIRAVVPKVGLMDAGLAWLFDVLAT